MARLWATPRGVVGGLNFQRLSPKRAWLEAGPKGLGPETGVGTEAGGDRRRVREKQGAVLLEVSKDRCNEISELELR